MSCVGKTTFAQQIGLPYCCFDALFPWHEIETFGLSTSDSLRIVRDKCPPDQFILDGWHTSDLEGKWLPEDVVVYCLFAPYDSIIDQYRVPVEEHNQHRSMYQKWYSADYPKLNARYWLNDGQFKEVDKVYFDKIISMNCNPS